MRLKVLNATWVEAAEVDVQECVPAFGHATGWHWSRTVALLCSRRNYCHAPCERPRLLVLLRSSS